jgi:uncharacterized protein (DUF433 family)
MPISHIEDRAGVPAIVGTRITVDDVLSYLLEPTMTEDSIGRLFDLTREQVAAARAYILTNPDTVLARHLQLEAKSDVAVNPPEVIERARQMHESLKEFKVWFASREAAEALQEASANGGPRRLPSFREWLAERESHQAAGT